MNVLLIGSGGREHALAWRISQSKLLTKLFIAPGNGGTRNHGENVNIGINDFDGIANLCLQNNITMIVVGPEEPLVNGIWDYFHQNEKLRHISVIGPSKEGAQLEGSKHFAKVSGLFGCSNFIRPAICSGESFLSKPHTRIF